jgi:polyisoprenoid-binding protein YceI
MTYATTTAQPVLEGRWHVDIDDSTATFTVRNLGKTVSGSVPIHTGSVGFGPDGALVSVRGEVDLGALDTGNPRRDKDLRKPRLLGLDEHPTASFVAEDVTPATSGWTVTGALHARGKQARVEFHADRDRAATGLVVLAEATFDRKALGIRAPRLMIGRTITVQIRARLVPAP